MLLMLVFSASCQQVTTECRFTFETMGTQASCRLMLPSGVSPDEAESIVRGTFAEVDTALSTWLPNSELSRLSRAPVDSAVNVSSMLRTCLIKSRELNERSGGAFDPTAESLMRLWGFYRRQGMLPNEASLDSAMADLGCWRLDGRAGIVVKEKQGTRFDLGGIAKGLALDLVVARLREVGLRDGLVDLGGNLYCLGGAPGREDWRIGIRDPHNSLENFATLTMSDVSVATSGSYERFVEIDGHRYGHIMNPATGKPAEGLLSVTVVSPEGILADGLSTTLFVLGPEKALAFLEKHYPGVDAVLVVPGVDGALDSVLITRGLRGRLSLVPGFEKRYLSPDPESP